MQHKLYRDLRESFHASNLPVPPLPPYKQLPRIAIQNDAPRPLWSCGTIAMCTTLNLLLGNEHPHTMPVNCITRGHIIALQQALLK